MGENVKSLSKKLALQIDFPENNYDLLKPFYDLSKLNTVSCHGGYPPSGKNNSLALLKWRSIISPTDANSGSSEAEIDSYDRRNTLLTSPHPLYLL